VNLVYLAKLMVAFTMVQVKAQKSPACGRGDGGDGKVSLRSWLVASVGLWRDCAIGLIGLTIASVLTV
jgi:hypothetical protein